MGGCVIIDNMRRLQNAALQLAVYTALLVAPAYIEMLIPFYYTADNFLIGAMLTLMVASFYRLFYAALMAGGLSRRRAIQSTAALAWLPLLVVFMIAVHIVS